MQTVNASTFKAKCLALMDQVARTGKPLLVTKKGKPIAELRPHLDARPRSPFGMHQDLVAIKGDILAPIDGEWDALQ